MRSSIALVAAVAATTHAMKSSAKGSGYCIVNQCDFEIPFKVVPPLAPGAPWHPDNIQTLAPRGKIGSVFNDSWTQMDFDAGWSVKINPIDDWSNIYQLEYTYRQTERVWWDLSFVDGVQKDLPPWYLDCTGCPEKPKQQAYRDHLPHDDDYGMQVDTPPTAMVTMYICWSGSAAPSAPAPAPSSEAPAPTTTFATSTSDLGLKQANVQAASAPPATTEAPAPAPVVPTPTPAAVEDFDVVTEYVTNVVTAVVTETAHARKRRHEHRHPHGHRA